MKFARWVFWIAAAYGLIALLPLFFQTHTGATTSADQRPITDLEFYYGFLGVALAWQFAFFMIGYDPLRFRPMMLPCLIEKFSFTLVTTVLYLQHRTPLALFLAGLIDCLIGILFIIAWIKVGRDSRARTLQPQLN